MNEYKQSQEYNQLAEQIKSQLRSAIAHASPYLDRLEKMQAAYECQMPEDWQTYSEIYLPIIRTAVEEALPEAYNYLFPSSNMLSLSPTEPMPYELVQKVQNYFEDYIRNKSGLKEEGLLTLKDGMKLNLGYSITESKVITPTESILKQVISTEESVDIREIQQGEPKEIACTRYVDWRQIIPMPDGRNPEKTSGVFFLDDMRQDTFSLMYEMQKDSDVKPFKGNPKEIIDDVRNGTSSMAHFPIWWIWGRVSTDGNPITNMEALNQINKITVEESSPVRIPILKCYFNNEHIWMTPDGTIIYHIKDSIQTFRCPVNRACPVPDGDKWFVMGDVESGRDAADGANVFQNAVMDILSHNLHPTRIINRQIVHDNDAPFEPHGIVEVNGKVGEAVEYVSTPQLPGGIAGIGGELQNQFAASVGKPRELRGQGTAGVMRGGGLAFESLLQSTMGRAKLAGAVLEMGWLQTAIQDLIIMVQILGTDDSYIEQEDQTKNYIQTTITANEFKHGFIASVVLDDKLRQSASDKAQAIQLYSLLKDDPRFDWTAVGTWIVETLQDREVVKRLLASNEVRDAQIQELAERAQAQKAQQNGQNPAMQAMQGQEAERVSR